MSASSPPPSGVVPSPRPAAAGLQTFVRLRVSAEGDAGSGKSRAIAQLAKVLHALGYAVAHESNAHHLAAARPASPGGRD